jgi:hypothetical protein
MKFLRYIFKTLLNWNFYHSKIGREIYIRQISMKGILQSVLKFIFFRIWIEICAILNTEISGNYSIKFIIISLKSSSFQHRDLH